MSLREFSLGGSIIYLNIFCKTKDLFVISNYYKKVFFLLFRLCLTEANQHLIL